MFLRSREKEVVPRYLRASIGSCHDLCKYGKKHTLEEKPWPHARDLKLGSPEPKKVMVGKRRHVSFDACEIIKKEGVKQEQLMDSLQMKKTTNFKPVSESQISRNIGKSREGKDIGVKIQKDGSSKFGMKSVTPRGGDKSRHRKSLSLNQKPRDVQQIDYPVEEKILHVVEIEIENKLSKHDQIQSFVVEPSHHHPPTQEEYDEYTGTEKDKYEYSSVSKESENAEEETKNPRGGNEGESPPDETEKLHFKRGTVLNLRIEDDQGKSETKDDDDDDDVTDEDDNTNGGEVVLRHQDVEDKEDTERLLFNNVIEETASELVKSRNSKVKALVDAFETLISLQKFKPLVNSAI